MQISKAQESMSQPTKTFLAEYAVVTLGSDDERENCTLGLVEAPSLEAATELAIRAHCWEAFEDDDAGKWITYEGHRAFQLREDACEVDARSIYYINKMTEVPDADAPVLGKYLDVVRAETLAETA